METSQLISTLYVGAGKDGVLTEGIWKAVAAAASSYFESFTLTEARGYYKGRPVDTVLIKVATDDEAGVKNLAFRLLRELEQESIGIEREGRFSFVVAGETPDMPRGVLFKIPHPKGGHKLIVDPEALEGMTEEEWEGIVKLLK